ncbi:SH3 domain-containing protein [Leucothrix arctica]|uniref:SH3b domain-containing protein n=1 Tax=Leucothrix arctica TaxID=1481894 RepID=A0A317CJ99_9GAMM|nr:SH3 domain-containing protein [Leucothrix arctica]PWQ98261.1 hypothetical protein DKT75_03760 [Leucothrix arctica]
MKKIISLFLGASLFMVNLSAYAQTTYYTTAGIPESSTLTLRAWPSHVSQPIANIPHNTTEIIPTGKNILLNENNWLQVAFENQVGWVEASYVSELPAESAAPTQQAAVFAMPEPEAETYTEAAPTTEQYDSAAEPTLDSVPWSASADSIYEDPHNTTQQPKVMTTTHSVVVIPNTAEEIDLRNEGVTHSRYSSIDASISLQYEQSQ